MYRTSENALATLPPHLRSRDRSDDTWSRSARRTAHSYELADAYDDLSTDIMMAHVDAATGESRSVETYGRSSRRAGNGQPTIHRRRRAHHDERNHDEGDLIDVSRSIDNYRRYFRERFAVSMGRGEGDEMDDGADVEPPYEDERVGRALLSERGSHHGSRGPRRATMTKSISIAMPKRFMPNSNVWKGNCHTGALTAHGVRQLRQLGTKLYQTYADLLGGARTLMHPDRIFVRSTDIPRTLASAQSLLTGFTEMGLAELWIREYLGENGGEPGSKEEFVKIGLASLLPQVPIYTADFLVETFAPNVAACPRIMEMMVEVRNHPEWQAHNATVTTSLAERVREAMQGLHYQTELRNLFDCLGSHLCNNNTMPGNVTPKLFKEIEDEIKWQDMYLYFYPNRIESSQLMIGGFLHQFGSNILHRVLSQLPQKYFGRKQRFQFEAPSMSGVSNSQSLRFSLYSGHDTSLMAMLVALDAYNFTQSWPPYASHIEFELIKSRIEVPPGGIEQAGFGARLDESFPASNSSYGYINGTVGDTGDVRNSPLLSAPSLVEHFLSREATIHADQQNRAERVTNAIQWVTGLTNSSHHISELDTEMDQYFVRIVYNGIPLPLRWCQSGLTPDVLHATPLIRRFARALIPPTEFSDDAAAEAEQIMEKVMDELKYTCPLRLFLTATSRLSPQVDDTLHSPSFPNSLFDKRCGKPAFYAHFS